MRSCRTNPVRMFRSMSKRDLGPSPILRATRPWAINARSVRRILAARFGIPQTNQNRYAENTLWKGNVQNILLFRSFHKFMSNRKPRSVNTVKHGDVLHDIDGASTKSVRVGWEKKDDSKVPPRMESLIFVDVRYRGNVFFSCAIITITWMNEQVHLIENSVWKSLLVSQKMSSLGYGP